MRELMFKEGSESMIDLKEIQDLSDEATFEDTSSQLENETVDPINNSLPLSSVK